MRPALSWVDGTQMLGFRVLLVNIAEVGARIIREEDFGILAYPFQTDQEKVTTTIVSRAHQAGEDGYELFAKRQIIIVISRKAASFTSAVWSFAFQPDRWTGAVTFNQIEILAHMESLSTAVSQGVFYIE